MTPLDTLLSVALGIGLAAAVGLRVFLPLLVVSIAAWTGHLQLAENFAWVGTAPALATFAVAALAEVVAYYLPGVDNLLDTLAIPVALLAGTLVAAAVMTDLPPLVKWTTAVIAGGGAAGLTQGVTSLLRVKSTALTGGFGNAVLATSELGGALLISLLALAAPLAALALTLVAGWFVVRLARRMQPRRRRRRRRGWRASPDPATTEPGSATTGGAAGGGTAGGDAGGTPVAIGDAGPRTQSGAGNR